MASARIEVDCGHEFSGKAVAKGMPPLFALTPQQRIVDLMALLMALQNDRRNLALTPQPRYRTEKTGRVEKVCVYLKNHFAEPLDYKRLARHVNMEQAPLCRLFKRTMGSTITEYLIELRVTEAERLLIETEQSILEVSLRTGFESYSNFVRQFRRFLGLPARTLRNRIP